MLQKHVHHLTASSDNVPCWCLQDTHRTLMPAKQSATNGHVTLLKQKMLTAILRRVDSVLFEKLTAGMPAVLLDVVKLVMHLDGGLSMQITSLHRNQLDIVTPVLRDRLMMS